MTREEFKELCSIRDRVFLESKLYDILFNRTCGTCKHSKYVSDENPQRRYICLQLVREDCNREENSFEFGCSHWENKW